MSTEDTFENSKDKLSGRLKEGVGKLTGDKEVETEGKVQQGKADVADAVHDAKDTVKGAVDGLRGTPDDSAR
ncbi:CsbD family protein [Brachybacterium sp. J144]|uniref:CsbD family protein n=1 Tax=Brachybacterium sp. J144 TaxID=3116487 RepID=UPI002E75CE81|nr:CsbD family protein [Brachybacterium sp. J144]MEE1651438.1 CsbD family protein [Brachybacterium sp. J144]